MKDFFRLDFFKNNDLLIVVALIFGILIFATLLFFVIGKINPSANLTELKARTKSWWVMAIIFIAATIFNTKISYVAIAFLSFVAFREMYSLIEFRLSDRRAIFWAFISIPVQYYLAYIGMVWSIYHFYTCCNVFDPPFDTCAER